MDTSALTVRSITLFALAGLVLIAGYFWSRYWLSAESVESDEAAVSTLEKGVSGQVVTRVDRASGSAEGSSVSTDYAGSERVHDGQSQLGSQVNGAVTAAGSGKSGGLNAVAVADGFDWRIPAWLPPPPVPADNPMSEVKVRLGRHLFHDQRLSRDGSISCASCHQQSRGFSDGLALSPGVGGSLTERNSMSLANVGYSPALTWANPHLKSLERQALVPLFSEEPVEMGLAGREQALFARLQQDPLYRELFAEAFPERDGRIGLGTITRALAAFQRTLISVDSPYDRYRYGGQRQLMSEAALRGEALFYSEQAECYHCHQGFNFSDTLQTANSGFAEVAFYNTGLYNLGADGDYPAGGQGLYTFSQRPADMGRFRTQSLRNVAVTAPYFHDGSAATLDDVIEHYASGGRTLQGTHAGVGRDNPWKDPLIVGFDLQGSMKDDLKAFLQSLTDETFLNNPRFSNPWPSGHPARGTDRPVSTNDQP